MENLISLAEKIIKVERNRFLTVAGSIDTNVYYVESGSLRISVADNFEERIIRFGYQQDFVFLLDSFLAAKPTAFSIQAIKKTVVKVIPKKKIDDFLKNEINQRTWTELLQKMTLQQMEREIDLLKQSPKERYERVLNRSPRLFQEIPQKHIANYLRMSAETLSRLQKP